MAKAPSPPPSKGIAAAIRANVPKSKPGFACWHNHIPADVLADLEELKRDQREGRLACKPWALAKTISRELKERGVFDIGPQGVMAWLKG